jgi:hypothetical protein
MPVAQKFTDLPFADFNLKRSFKSTSFEHHKNSERVCRTVQASVESFGS